MTEIGQAQLLNDPDMPDHIPAEAEARVAAYAGQAVVSMDPGPGGRPPRPQYYDRRELTSSEPSDGEVENGAAVVLYRTGSHSKNRLHIPNELFPSMTACPKRSDIQTMTAVSVTEEKLATMTSTLLSAAGLCVACVAARPNRFPEAVVKALVK